jgi:succinyl-CoA synthetase alpha subunit
MRKATMVFEATNKPGVVVFVQGRIHDKGRRWGKEMSIGRTKFEGGKEYPQAQILELTANGIRVSVDPVQPRKVVTVDPASWKEAKIEAPNTEPVSEEDEVEEG